MWKYAFWISYVGTGFSGWQKQPGRSSIQETLETQLTRMTGEKASIVGSGRTDSGVHASGQVAHFVLRRKLWSPLILHKGLNALLPESIRVLKVWSVDLEFHAQRSALKKQYSYYFQQGPSALPFLLPFSWWIQKKLDLEAMGEGVEHLVGKHNFKPFQASGSKPGPTTREILLAEVTREKIFFPGLNADGGNAEGFFLVRLRLIGSGFLKQMVRGIAGTLLQVGEGRRSSRCFAEILKEQDRSLVGPTAPARGLWLEHVWY